MAGKYGSQSITISYDGSPGGSPQTITNHVLTLSPATVVAAMEPSHAFGDGWEERTPTGLGSGDNITIEGHWDTTATTGPHAVLGVPDRNPQDATRTLTIGYGDGKTYTAETRLVKYEVLGQVANLTRFRAEIAITGQPVWS
jgi:hypothetical protein